MARRLALHLFLLLLLAACEGPPSLAALPAARQLGEDPAGIGEVAVGDDDLAWTTSAQEHTGRVYRWQRGQTQALAVAQERQAPRSPVVSATRTYWIEVDGAGGYDLFALPHGSTASERIHVLLAGDELHRLTPLVAAGDELIVWATLPDASHALLRIAADGSTAVVARLAWDALLAAHANQSFCVFTGLVGRRAEALTLTIDDLRSGSEVSPSLVDLDPLRVVGGLFAGVAAYVWQDPGEPGLPAAVRVHPYVGGGGGAIGPIPADAGGLAVMPFSDEAWLRAPHALIVIRGDGTSVRYEVPYDPVAIVGDLGGLVVTARDDGGDRPTRVLLQPIPPPDE
jgi:hypothetical protein